MSDIKEQILISRYLVSYLKGNCGEKEKLIVEEWLKKDKNRAAFEKFKQQKASVMFEKREIDISYEKKSFYNIIDRNHRFRLYKRISVAAGIIIIFSLSFLFWTNNNLKHTKYSNEISKIIPRQTSPVLLTSDGREINLDRNKDLKIIKNANGEKIVIIGDSVRHKSLNPKNEISYNTIKVPQNTTYHFKLNDGTSIWLNANSEIKYPVPFHKDRREVFLKGEAFFNVSKNKNKPFTVNINGGRIKVLGTSFNIKNYNPKNTLTTLVTGLLEVSDNKNNSVIIKPNQQAGFENNTITVRKNINTYDYICWKDGIFSYNSVSLDIIFQELSEWYGISFFYQNADVSQITFSGKINRYNDIDSVLKIIEETGDIKFRRKNRTVTIYSNK